jgi:hypothetical protein
MISAPRTRLVVSLLTSQTASSGETEKNTKSDTSHAVETVLSLNGLRQAAAADSGVAVRRGSCECDRSNAGWSECID